MENINEIDFIPNEKYRTENTLFGPVNNRYKKKTNDELVDAAAWLNEKNCTKAIDNFKEEYGQSIELKYEEYATGKSHCKSLSSNLGNLLDWFDKHSFSIAATTSTISMNFKQNLTRLFEFEAHKKDMINE